MRSGHMRKRTRAWSLAVNMAPLREQPVVSSWSRSLVMTREVILQRMITKTTILMTCSDPLNWPIGKTITTPAILSLASFTSIGQSTCNQGGFLLQGETYGKAPTQVANSISAAVVGMATTPFLWAWLSRRIGRTSVIFWALLLNSFVNIWSACMTGHDQYVPFVVSRWLGGAFGSAPCTIGAGIIIDIFFLHQRGKGEAKFLEHA